MNTAAVLLLFIAVIISLSTGMVFLAGLFFIALVVIILFSFLSGTAGAIKKTGKSLTKGTMNELETAKGQSPKSVAEFAKMLEATGQKTGEMAYAKDKEVWKSPDLAGRIGQGSKNLLEALGRLFK